ncbi:znF_C3H1 and WWE domain-containing protein [Anabas testudineus]|uniref:Uncharacterized protein n=1 Tax=Anabas testudineus TaxID=64144 RepID=A0A3Q1JAA4_ANATE|nr:znF_C3H1 and WWE domain-containing protein [Anabas testudineus]
MAAAQQSDSECSSTSGSDLSDSSHSDEDSDVDVSCQSQGKPCKYYNKGHCEDGSRCLYLHVCEYALKGNCRYGSSCKLNHPTGGKGSSHGSNLPSNQSAKADIKLTNGQLYQWQLNDGKGWKDIDQDHIIEAQYCLPHTKSIKIYNTPYGAVSIDFNRMRVYGKSLRVRRLDDGNTVWIWYCSLSRKWRKYGDKDSKGNTGPVKSSDIEKKFQSNPSGSFNFNIGSDTFEIRFREMRQLSKKRKRRVTRRPVYRQQAGTGVSQVGSALQNMSLGTTHKWQYEGHGGKWHEFKQGSGTTCSVSSDDIERKYQQNHLGSMNFKVKGQLYKLDFGAMIQTNLSTNKKRNIRRV